MGGGGGEKGRGGGGGGERNDKDIALQGFQKAHTHTTGPEGSDVILRNLFLTRKQGG